MDDPPRKPDSQAGWYHRSEELELTPSSEADALDRIAETVRVGDLWSWGERLDEIAAILRETGRLS